MAAPEPRVDDQALAAFVSRKRAELANKLAGIRTEWTCWLQATEPKQPLRKHQSQIVRLVDQLDGLTDVVGERIAALGDAPDRVLSEARELQLRVLEVHRLWDYYRVKLNLRYVSWFRDYLAAADDLAWECYEPARKLPSDQAARAAPLVFLTGDFSPYTHARASQYELEPMRGALNSEQFRAVAASLPVPVIGVPWYQVSHLPDAPLIGHEIGHDLEAELKLTAGMQGHVAPVLNALDDQQRGYAWGEWLSEVHADLVGLMCTGPAFASAMVDLLVADPVQVVAEAREAAAYRPHPPASIRIRVLAAALELQELHEASAALTTAWNAAFGALPAGGYRDDAPKVVAAIWNGKHEHLGGTLAGLLAFSARQQRDAETVRDTVLGGFPTAIADVRALIAGARLAYDAAPEKYETPRGPDKKTPQELVLSQIVGLRSDAPRKEELERSPARDDDRAAGRLLFDRITHATEPGS
jgi:hypothetical protein